MKTGRMARFLTLNISTIFIILLIECYGQQDSPKVIGGKRCTLILHVLTQELKKTLYLLKP